MTKRNIGNIIKILRKKNEFTLQDLSKKTNISISYLSDLENGRGRPSIERIVEISKALNTTVNVLIGLDDSPFNNPISSESTEIIDIIDSFINRLATQKNITYKGQPLFHDDINSLITGIKVGSEICLSDIKEKRNKLKNDVIELSLMVKSTYGTNPLDICEGLSLAINYSEFPLETPGFLVTIKNKPSILINSNLNESRRRIALFQQIGNYLLNEKNPSVDLGESDFRNNNKALICEMFTAEMSVDEGIFVNSHSLDEISLKLDIPVKYLKLKLDLMNYKNQISGHLYNSL